MRNHTFDRKNHIPTDMRSSIADSKAFISHNIPLRIITGETRHLQLSQMHESASKGIQMI